MDVLEVAAHDDDDDHLGMMVGWFESYPDLVGYKDGWVMTCVGKHPPGHDASTSLARRASQIHRRILSHGVSRRS